MNLFTNELFIFVKKLNRFILSKRFIFSTVLSETLVSLKSIGSNPAKLVEDLINTESLLIPPIVAKLS